MQSEQTYSIDNLVRAGSLLARNMDFQKMVAQLVEQSSDITKSDLAALYLYQPEKKGKLQLIYKRGRYEPPKSFSTAADAVVFLEESKEAIILNRKKEINQTFEELFLTPEMGSAIAYPIATDKAFIGALVLNSFETEYFGREVFHFLDSYTKLAGGFLHNALLYDEMQKNLKRVEELERYQKSIFSSMTNILVTVDKSGSIRYFNKAAADSLGLEENDLDRDFSDVFKDSIDKKIVGAMGKVLKNGHELLGIEGIFHRPESPIDFSLNISPIKGEKSRIQGTTLLFTDQSKEKKLASEVVGVREQGRVVKDLFSRYLSQEVVGHLMENPDKIKMGGNKLVGTIFFADIRGYTSFSEGKEPEYIIQVLNEYFEEAVDVVLSNKGYIDKFIGDCIMAAWGVPVANPAEDAINAVNAAWGIQELVTSKSRKFFKGKAKDLGIGIGMHTGPLVSGNLGSSQRMEFTVIGDTVNVAARLEGQSKKGEVIISQSTREYLADYFLLEQRESVTVKGKSQPIPIYSVKGRRK